MDLIEAALPTSEGFSEDWMRMDMRTLRCSMHVNGISGSIHGGIIARGSVLRNGFEKV